MHVLLGGLVGYSVELEPAWDFQKNHLHGVELESGLVEYAICFLRGRVDYRVELETAWFSK